MDILNKGFQEKSLEDYLFTGVQKSELYNTQIEEGRIFDSKINQPVTKEKFLETLQQFHTHHSISTDRDFWFFDDQLHIKRITVVLLTSQNIERISKRIMLSQDQNIMFKLENSARVIKPIAINSSDPKVMDMQFENFKVDASILLKQNKTCKHVYLLNGSPVFSLIDIPEDCSVLFLSHSPFFSKMVGESSKIFNKSPSKYKNFYLNKAFKNSSKINIRTEENEYAFNNLLDNSKMLFSNKLKESEWKEIENKLSKRYTKHIPEEVITTLKVLLKGSYIQ